MTSGSTQNANDETWFRPLLNRRLVLCLLLAAHSYQQAASGALKSHTTTQQ